MLVAVRLVGTVASVLGKGATCQQAQRAVGLDCTRACFCWDHESRVIAQQWQATWREHGREDSVDMKTEGVKQK